SCGIDCNPPNATTIMNGKPNQTFVRIAARNASTGDVSHATAARFMYLANTRLLAPYPQLNIPRHVNAVMYCGNAHGRISRTRQADFPRMKCWCNTTARNTPSVTWKNTLTTVHTTVLNNTSQNRGSAKTAAYC